MKARKSLVALVNPLSLPSLGHAEFQRGSRSLGSSQDSRCDRRCEINTSIGEAHLEDSDQGVVWLAAEALRKFKRSLGRI